MAVEDKIDIDKIKKEVYEGMCVDRQKLLMRFPFTGAMMMKFQLVPVRDARLDTAATDGHNVYMDCDFYSRLSPDERVFVLAHEVWHVVLLHLVRKQTRKHFLFNIATDMEVNRLLKNNNFKLIDGALLPPEDQPQLKEANAETIYEWLVKQQKDEDKKNGKGKGKGNKGDGEGNGKSKSQKNGKNGKGCKCSEGNCSGQFDNHVYEGETPDDVEGQMPSDRWGEKGLDEDFSPKVEKNITEKMRSAVLEAANTVQRSKGTLPAGLEAYVKELLKPEINWKERLAQFVTKCFGGGRVWGPYSRRNIYRRLYLPAMRSEKIKVGILLDTSGSCVNDEVKFLSEVNALLKTFGRYEITMIQCDADVHKVDTFTDDKPFIAKDYEIRGGGGSDFRPVEKYIKKNNMRFDCMCVFTDLFIDIPSNPPPWPVLWIVPKNGSTEKPKYGEVIRFNNENE